MNRSATTKSPFTRIVMYGDMNPASSPEARAYLDRKRATEKPVAPAPIPARKLVINMEEVARLNDWHNELLTRFASARRS
jgi:hypothetical protein